MSKGYGRKNKDDLVEIGEPETKERDTPLVKLETDRLESLITRLVAKVDQIEKSLSPILRPDKPSIGEDKSGEETGVPLHRTLESFVDRLDGVLAQLVSIDQRIEV